MNFISTLGQQQCYETVPPNGLQNVHMHETLIYNIRV